MMILAAGALAPAAAALSQTPPAKPTGLGIRLLEVPAARSKDPRAQTYVVDHLAPGSSIQRRFEIRNDTDGPTRVRIYAGAAAITNKAFVPAVDEQSGEITKWVSLSASSASLAKGATRQVEVTIAVPADASSGERYGVVWAELPPVASGTGVNQVNRVGIRIYLSVGPGGEPATSFQIVTLTARRETDGVPAVTAVVHNTGERAVDLSGELTLGNGPGGTTAGPFPAKLGTTLTPGSSGSVDVPLRRGLPAGPWDAQLTMRSGALEQKAAARITFPSAPGTSSKAGVTRSGDGVTRSGEKGQDGGADNHGRSVVVTIVGAVALSAVILLLLLLLFAARRRRDRD